jgi:hypothetical protein
MSPVGSPVEEELLPLAARSNSSEFEDSFTDHISKYVTLKPLPPVATIRSKYGSFRRQFLNVYQRLFSIVFIANLIAFVVILIRGRTTRATLQAATANLLVCGLSRLPFVINSIYMIICSIPPSAPLFIRKIAARASHYGGIHSGCGVAALFWYTAFTALLTREYYTNEPLLRPPTAVLVLVYFVLFDITSMIMVAYPIFRFLRHDIFELTHRYSSWLIVILFWAAYLQLVNFASKIDGISTGSSLVHDVTFWFAIMLTAALISPWITLRKVSVDPEYLSEHAVRLHFTYATTKFSQGVSVSTNPFKDWHSFAGLQELDGRGFSIVISNAGDWTSRCIKNQPRRLWTRAVPTYGFAYAAQMFRRALIVVTGSGIGPTLSIAALKKSRRPPFRVLWQTREPRKTYGDRILEELAVLDPDAVIIDSDKYGRQDMTIIAWNLAIEFEAEAVFIVSNPLVVRKFVNTFEDRGIPAYGPIFDS